MPGRIQEALEARGITQKTLAEMMGVSQSSITRAGAKGMAL
jgi:transcriptional regulator with XRE-family HTH domain